MLVEHRSNLFLFFVTILCTFLLLAPTTVFAGKKVIWSQEHLELDVKQGESITHEITLTVEQELGPVELEAISSISDIVSFSPNHFESLKPGETYTVQVHTATSNETRVGAHRGTVHLRMKKATLPATIKLHINVDDADVNHDDNYVSAGLVELVGVSEKHFNGTTDTVGFQLSGTAYSSNPLEIMVFHQEVPVPASQMSLTSNLISVTPTLASGENNFILIANDIDGKLIYKTFTLWAGNRTLSGYVVDENNHLVNQADIEIRLGDDQSVTAQVSSTDGTFSFSNLPARTVMLSATTPSALSGSTAANGGQGSVSIITRPLFQPSLIDNNNFTLGIEGWNIGSAPVYLIPHEEATSSLASESETLSATIESDSLALSREEKHAQQSSPTSSSTVESSVTTSLITATADMDLLLATSGEGPQTITRTFNTSEGVRNIKVRYRFITTEIPGGYFGTQYNDYFSVRIRTTSDSVSESNSMNGLGLGAFDAAGRTSWREKQMTVNPDGETVQIELTVANVADGFLNSFLVVDLIEENPLAITHFELNDIDNTSLGHLSASAHTYFGGNTRIHGVVTVEGVADDALALLELEVVQNGVVVASAEVDTAPQSALYQTFGDDNQVTINSSQLLFNLNPAAINSTQNGTVSLRLHARAESGAEVTEEGGAVNILSRYTGTNRYGDGRDEIVGGDDWAKPSVVSFINSRENMIWGDFSNMNGGAFAPHASHQTGNDVDGWFNGYNQRDANTALSIINHLNNSAGRITVVFATYTAAPGNAFFDAINGVVLDDGRNATDVIRPVGGHRTHFHWRVTD